MQNHKNGGAPSGADPDLAEFQEAVRWHQAGDLVRAETVYQRLSSHHALAADCLHLLGVIAGQRGLHEESEARTRLAMRLSPNRPEFFENLTVALEKQGKLHEAINAQIDLGAILQNSGKHHEAVNIYQKVMALAPHRLDVMSDLGAAHHAVGEYSKSLSVLTGALVRSFHQLPGGRELTLQIARLAENVVQVPEAADGSVERLDALPALLVNLFQTLFTLSHTELSSQVLQSLFSHLQLLPANPNTVALAHWNHALLSLYRRDFSEGWKEYEWRWKWSGFGGPRRGFKQPVWHGETLSGKTLLIIAEQGFGDTLQFAPLIREAAKLAKRVIFEVHQELFTIIERNFKEGNIEVIPRTDNPAAVHGSPHFDFFVALMSLPQRIALNLQMLPLYASPLAPDAATARRWARKLAGVPGLNVGVAWAGSPAHGRDRERSLQFSQLAPLLAVEGTNWFSLQFGEAAASARGNAQLIDHSDSLKTFDDTAAMISGLDLIIAVDTALAHLAGSMGKETWVMLSFVPDFRWFETGERTPWYPSLRLFRQHELGDWGGVVQHVVKALVCRLPNEKGLR